MSEQEVTSTKEDKPIHPRWGYSKDGPKLFENLREGDKLPAGYYDSPAKVPGDANKKSDIAGARA